MSFAKKSDWRLIISPAYPGKLNMAVDEVLLENAGSPNRLPILRLYTWQPACLSIGYAQPISDVDLSALHANGWDLVRRPTGGRAILHADELTYAIIGSQNEPRLSGGVLESYRIISRALLSILHRIGIQAEASSNQDSTIPSRENQSIDPNPVCFEVPSNYEITFQGKKIIGSAQARRKEGILQHGSIPISGDLTRIISALNFPTSLDRKTATDRLILRASTLESLIGYSISWDILAAHTVEAFEQALNINFHSEELSNGEYKQADILIEKKYGNWEWTART